MKKLFFLFAMLTSVAVSAQSHIKLKMLSATYTATPTVQFSASWTSIPTQANQTHNAKIWVWIDYVKVNADNTTSGNTWTRALVSGTPTATSGAASREAGNDKGFWLTGSTTTYSATVTVPLTLEADVTKFNWCAYTSDYPPNVLANTNGSYTLAGTPPFTLIAANGTTKLSVPGKTIAASAVTFAPATITDATGCPGLWCPYTGSDLYMDNTHRCLQRQSGVKNWEAWIKDSRDNQYYRIINMPDNKWWMGQNLNYRGVSYACYGGNAANCNETNGAWYHYPTFYQSTTICPSGWHIPSMTEWTGINLGQTGRDMTAISKGGNDSYGWTAQMAGIYYVPQNHGWMRGGETDSYISTHLKQGARVDVAVGFDRFLTTWWYGQQLDEEGYKSIRCVK
jgi:uncharacterized protein (TIGR02145 family)